MNAHSFMQVSKARWLGVMLRWRTLVVAASFFVVLDGRAFPDITVTSIDRNLGIVNANVSAGGFEDNPAQQIDTSSLSGVLDLSRNVTAAVSGASATAVVSQNSTITSTDSFLSIEGSGAGGSTSSFSIPGGFARVDVYTRLIVFFTVTETVPFTLEATVSSGFETGLYFANFVGGPAGNAVNYSVSLGFGESAGTESNSWSGILFPGSYSFQAGFNAGSQATTPEGGGFVGRASGSFSADLFVGVPEPSSGMLVSLAFAAYGAFARRR